jgi:minor extracellular serine protease Vpr
MRKLLVRGATLVAAVATVGIAFGVQAQTAEIQEIPNAPAVAPAGHRSTATGPVKVVVILGGDPVAVVQRDLGRALTAAERNSVIAQRMAEHPRVVAAIQRLGGRVLAQYQSALNGIKIEIPRQLLPFVRSIPGVVDVQGVGVYERNNATSVPLIGAPQAWQLPAALQGQGVKIAIIDTGIDFTHANFGGPGTVAAYQAAKAANTLPANPAWFGPAAPKVKGGYDLVGDAYTGSSTPPVPDPNPLDCESTSGSVGHGSHVAGTTAGFGVKADGTTFTGPYNAAAYTPGAFSIGPGVAPKADLYAVRVFGCSGSTDVVAEAIDWAVANGMNVINMSLGSSFGNVGNGDAGSLAEKTAVANAAAAGIVVVASSGNSGPTPYITGSPAVFPGAISVAATDALAGIPTATLALAGSSTITVQNSNGAAFANGSNWPIVVLRNPNGTVSLGCNPDEYDKTKNGGIDITGKLVVTVRGTCARTFRAGAAQHFGAAAAAMINTDPGFPPYEGSIPGGAATPADGNIYEPVTIPFFGVRSTDGDTLSGPQGGLAPASALANNAGILANPNFLRVASFSSGGPRIGDSVLRPGITAPGVSTVSTASGTGNGFSVLSGTSMAAPHVAGVAALLKQANPTWSVADLRAALVQTSSPSLMADYSPRNEGAGLVQPLAAVSTQAVVRTPDESLSFGYADLLSDFSQTKQVTLYNAGPKAVQFNISVTKSVGPASVTVTTPASVIVNGNSEAQFPVTLNMPASAGTGGTTFQDVGGYIKLTPSNSRLNGNVALSVPYYLVTHGRSNVAGSIAGNTLNLTNSGSALATTTPSFWTWGLHQPAPQGIEQLDIRSVGTALSGTDVFFGINTHNRTSTTLAFQEVDICIDTSGGPGFTPNKVLIGINRRAFGSTQPITNYAVALFPTDANCNINGSGSLLLNITQPTDNSTLQLAVPRGGTGTSGLGLTAGNPRFKYRVFYYGTDGIGALMPGIGTFNAFTPALTFANTGAVAANGTRAVTITQNAAEAALSPSLGVMVLAPDNVSGASQGLLFPSSPPP